MTLTTDLNLKFILATTYADMEIMMILNTTEIPATLKLLKKYLIICMSRNTPIYPSKQSALGRVNPGSARGSAFNEEIATQITGNREMKHTRIITTYETIFPKVPTPWTASFSLPFLCLLIIFCLLSVFSHETAC
jgi:hypothetical protein